jgi:hypothetical protein
MKNSIFLLLLVLCPSALLAQMVTTVRGEVKKQNRQVRVGDRLNLADQLIFGKGGIVVYRAKNGVFVMKNLVGMANLANAVAANKVNMEGLRNTEMLFLSYQALRDYLSVSGDKKNPTPFLIIGEGTFRVDDEKYLVSPQTPYYLFPAGVATTENAILLPQKDNTFLINAALLRETGVDTSQPTFFKLVYKNSQSELAWITDCLLVFAEKAEIEATLKLTISDMQGSSGTEIENACIESLHAAYGMPDGFLIRKMLVGLGVKF